MTKILIYGGCHARILQRLLSRALIGKATIDVIINYEIIEEGIPFPKYRIPDYDHFIFSPIVNKEEWNTDDIVNVCRKKGVNTISYPWLQWNGYFPGVQKISVLGVQAWFYQFIIDEMQNHCDVHEFIESIIKGGVEKKNIEENIISTTNRLKQNEHDSGTDVIISDFILYNYKKKRLFLTPDHPSRFVYQELLKRIIPKLGFFSWPTYLFREPQNEAWTPILPSVARSLNLSFSNTTFRASGYEPCSLVHLLTALFERKNMEEVGR
ncbi:hypothetical protein F9K98_24945 [Brucella anthropi]|uniref:WcbI family polysaccharide biosynthesis putative acetyltransferase n=1 Tax=Brucella anthropi TaxID=529 RepID=UPI00124D8953|nr:WcbI family polysaccharide biosynthesis putative acetyltransferase [Brucella anthropi]KAB2755183.1 hypothetical protein F9K98_24945 [Brucella anthropi]